MISEVYNIDCMEYMQTLPDKFFDLAIVDPPYGINISEDLHKRGVSCSKNGFRQYALKKWDSEIPDSIYFSELKRISKNQVVWGGELLLRAFRQ